MINKLIPFLVVPALLLIFFGVREAAAQFLIDGLKGIKGSLSSGSLVTGLVIAFFLIDSVFGLGFIEGRPSPVIYYPVLSEPKSQENEDYDSPAVKPEDVSKDTIDVAVTESITKTGKASNLYQSCARRVLGSSVTVTTASEKGQVLVCVADSQNRKGDKKRALDSLISAALQYRNAGMLHQSQDAKSMAYSIADSDRHLTRYFTKGLADSGLRP